MKDRREPKTVDGYVRIFPEDAREKMEKKINCALCKKPIQKYHPAYNHLEIDESCSADICLECADKFSRWQQRVLSDLFPTKAAKKRYGRV